MLLRYVMRSIMMTILAAKRLLMGVCILSGLRSQIRWARHFDACLRQSSGGTMGRADGVVARVEVCVLRRSKKPPKLQWAAVFVMRQQSSITKCLVSERCFSSIRCC